MRARCAHGARTVQATPPKHIHDNMHRSNTNNNGVRAVRSQLTTKSRNISFKFEVEKNIQKGRAASLSLCYYFKNTKTNAKCKKLF